MLIESIPPSPHQLLTELVRTYFASDLVFGAVATEKKVILRSSLSGGASDM